MIINWKSRNTLVGAISVVFITAAVPSTTINRVQIQPDTKQKVTFVTPAVTTTNIHKYQTLPDYKLDFKFITPVKVKARVQFGKKFYEKHLDAKVFNLQRDEEELMIILEIIKRLL